MAQASAGMVSLFDVIGLEGPLRCIVQFGGLRLPGTVPLVSRDANRAITDNLVFALHALKEIEVDIDARPFHPLPKL